RFPGPAPSWAPRLRKPPPPFRTSSGRQLRCSSQRKKHSVSTAYFLRNRLPPAEPQSIVRDAQRVQSGSGGIMATQSLPSTFRPAARLQESALANHEKRLLKIGRAHV